MLALKDFEPSVGGGGGSDVNRFYRMAAGCLRVYFLCLVIITSSLALL